LTKKCKNRWTVCGEEYFAIDGPFWFFYFLADFSKKQPISASPEMRQNVSRDVQVYACSILCCRMATVTVGQSPVSE
jgi:hypothetical protein